MPSLFETEPKFNIEAAKADPAMRLHAQALRRAGIEISKRLTVGELDLQLAGSPLSTVERIALKSSMSRAGLLV